LKAQCDDRNAVTTQSPGLPRFGGYPGKTSAKRINPNGVAPNRHAPNDARPTGLLPNRHAPNDATPLGLIIPSAHSQGSRQSAATLGWDVTALRLGQDLDYRTGMQSPSNNLSPA